MSSYIRLEILLFFRAFETGVGMLVVYRLTDMLKRRLFCDRMWNSTVDILYWLLAGGYPDPAFHFDAFYRFISVQLWQNPLFYAGRCCFWWNFCKFCVK